jgi:DNA (cytosine-5)-methyltransferase 1
MMTARTLTSIEICAGAGGQALGLHRAGFAHEALVEIDGWACETLRVNAARCDYPWRVIGPEDPRAAVATGKNPGDVRSFSGKPFKGSVDLLAGGVPCPPFSKAGKQLGALDDRDLFPEMIRLAKEMQPRAILIENVRGLLDPMFAPYRKAIEDELRALKYHVVGWQRHDASDFGVPQLRPRVLMVAFREKRRANAFCWPETANGPPPDVGRALHSLMASDGWEGAADWARKASGIAPTLVGGSKKHGGPDLGPTRARREWKERFGINAGKLANHPPPPGLRDMPHLTVEMAAVIQGFPAEWFAHSQPKTHKYRQVGNAFPPPVAEAIGRSIACALNLNPRRRETGAVSSPHHSLVAT